MINPITKIFNTSLQQGIFSKHWKKAVIRPLLKKTGLALTTSNYRPVSNLTFLSKVVEKAALNQLVAHFDNNILMPDYQSVYRANQSCETAILKLVNDSLWAMENKYLTAMIKIELSAVFDTVDHDILLNTLHCKFGISDSAIEWVNSYLRPRSCKVNIKNSYSTERQLIFSVQQGSVAGPVLYLVYANTLEEVIQKRECYKSQSTPWNIESQKDIGLYGFADDHAIKKEFTPTKLDDESQCISSLEQCLINIKAWMD